MRRGNVLNSLNFCVLVIALLFLSCSRGNPKSIQVHGFRSSRAEFNLGDETRFDFKIGRIASDGRQRLLIAYEKYDRANGNKVGGYFRLSTDSGASFEPERPLPPASVSGLTYYAFTRDGLMVLFESMPRERTGVNIFSARLDKDAVNWSEPVQINDEQDSASLNAGGGLNFIQSSENEIDCVWTDVRRGVWLTFFSASHDGGRTWTPNQPVEHDFREGQQLFPAIVAGADGRLLAFWQDARDRETLFDIRCSFSDDDGQHWSASQKVNDDGKPVWQAGPRAVAKGKQIYVAFGDYREPGEEGGNDWNIYFSASADNGQTWRPNIRVNDVQPGFDDHHALSIDDRGYLYCVWRSGRDSILGELYFTYSTDGGQSWSPSIQVAGGELLYREPWELIILSNGKLLLRWRETRPGFETTRLTWLEPQTSDVRSEILDVRPTPTPEAVPSFAEGERIFAEDFSNGDLARWQNGTGVWTVNDGALMGIEPGATAPFSIYARLKEPENYILRGRFKLDPLHHQMAYLYFRANPDARRSYVINNGFQTGVCLSIKEDDSPRIAFGPFALVGRPLAQRRFPFQNDRWYEFTLVVRPERVDYFVNGKWMLSYEGRLKLPLGSLGVGGFASAPTYFDDIVVSELK